MDSVEDVAGKQQCMGLVLANLKQQPIKECGVFEVAVVAKEGLTEVPVGSVQDGEHISWMRFYLRPGGMGSRFGVWDGDWDWERGPGSGGGGSSPSSPKRAWFQLEFRSRSKPGFCSLTWQEQALQRNWVRS